MRKLLLVCLLTFSSIALAGAPGKGRVFERMGLTDAQQEQVKTILKEQGEKRKQIHETIKPQLEALQAETDDRLMGAGLSAEQLQQLNKMQKRWKSKMHMKGGKGKKDGKGKKEK